MDSFPYGYISLNHYFPLPRLFLQFIVFFSCPAGDIGGQMGLFIGASILTILELFDYAYEVRRLASVCLLTRIPVERLNEPTHHSFAASDTFYRSKKKKGGGALKHLLSSSESSVTR